MQRNKGEKENKKDKRSFQENWRYQGNISCKDGLIKEKNGRDLTKAEEIKKRGKEYTEELYKKGLNDLDNHDGIITHLESDILEHEAFLRKVSGGDGIPDELFQILKDGAVKVLQSKGQQIWKTQQ